MKEKDARTGGDRLCASDYDAAMQGFIQTMRQRVAIGSTALVLPITILATISNDSEFS